MQPICPEWCLHNQAGLSHFVTEALGRARLNYFAEGSIMKKLLALTLSLASIGFVASSGEVKAAEKTLSATTLSASAASQWGYRNRRRHRSRVSVTTQSRYVRYGGRLYRETYQVRYLPNGRTMSRLISRVRVR